MGGGLMQLVAYGAQDIYLTGNPQITFFKVVYRRHTNFSMEAIQQTFSGGNGVNPVCTISRNGDLVHKMYLVSTKHNDARFTPRQIQTVELEIGGQRIDRQSGQWMDTWNELSTPESKAIGLKSMTGQIGADGTGVAQVHIPLLFWFCRNPGLALPLIALQYHEVKVKFTLKSSGNPAGFELYCDYIYLDTDERRRFAQVSHEYLIEQVQEQSSSGGSNKLNFNHPVKELIWSTGTKAESVGLKLNGHDRFSTREDEHFYLQQPFDYHTAVPKQNLPVAAQISTLDRTTVFSTIDADTVADKDFSGLGGTALNPINILASAGDITLNDGVITFQNDTPLVARMDLSIGDVLAFVFTHEASGPATGGNIGTYFANVIAPPVIEPETATIVTFSVSTPTRDLSNGTTQTITGPYTGSDTAVFNIYKVTNATSNQARTSKDSNPIGVYSFALKPEEHQPSGTCNFSRIDNAELTLTGASTGIIYAVNYNVLRIMSGMGGLAYSN